MPNYLQNEITNAHARHWGVHAGGLPVEDSQRSFTVSEAARIVGVTKPVIYRAIEEGRLITWRPWSKGDQRINIDELNRWAAGIAKPRDVSADAS